MFLLQVSNDVDNLRRKCKDYRTTLVSDGRKDAAGRPLINYVECGLLGDFFSGVDDFSGVDKTGENLAIGLAARIDVVVQVLASWRAFLGPDTSFGFIESLGYWDITGPDGTAYQNVDPSRLRNVTGWIPQLSDVTAMLLSAGERINPTPEVPLIDHYQIDYGMDGVEEDTIHYGPRPPVRMNYGRILGAESIMRAHDLQTGVNTNACKPIFSLG